MAERKLQPAIMAMCLVVALAASASAANLAYKPGKTFRDKLRDGTSGPAMVVVPAGRFLMGSPKDDPGLYDIETLQVAITIPKPFAVGKYEVTWEEWEKCVKQGGCEDNSRKGYSAIRSDLPGDAKFGRGRRPVINVSWEDAASYVKWLSAETGKTYRLLSEAEWEYAARAGSTGRYAWGNAKPTCRTGKKNTANFESPRPLDLLAGCNGRGTEPVGYSAPNAFGLYDMHGNVAEWTQDCFHLSIAGIPTDGSPWLTSCDRGGEGQVFRGGAFTGGAELARSSYRQATVGRDINQGFRIARELD